MRIGVAGLGAASSQILPCIGEVAEASLAAGADTRPEAREQFSRKWGLPSFESVEEMARSPDVDVVWVCTPNPLHCAHTVAAANAGKHVICEKPMAVTIEQCTQMIEAADRAGVLLLQGHSKIFDPPVKKMREVVASGRLGKVIQIDSMMYNDWMQRPRLASEVETKLGGGVVYRQGPHIVDIVRYIAGGDSISVRGTAGRRDPNFDTEGNFSALIDFASGAVAHVSFNGYGFFDVTELTWDIGESGENRAAMRAPKPRRTSPMPAQEKYDYLTKLIERDGSTYPQGESQPFFGLTIVSCERGVIRQSPDGLFVYDENGCEEILIRDNPGRAAELIELRDALNEGRDCFPNGRWGRATLEVCLGILQSGRERKEVQLLQPATV